MKIPDAKGAVDNGWNKLINPPAWQEKKVKRKQQLRKHRKKFTLPLLWTGVTSSIQKRQELPGAPRASMMIQAEQGCSASHMTAAKVLDVIQRLPGCAGEATELCLNSPK